MPIDARPRVAQASPNVDSLSIESSELTPVAMQAEHKLFAAKPTERVAQSICDSPIEGDLPGTVAS